MAALLHPWGLRRFPTGKLAVIGILVAVLNLSDVAVAPLGPVLAGALLSGMNVNLAMGTFAVLFIIGATVFSLYKPISSIGKPDAWEQDLVKWPPRAP
ncbi:MAG: hypothetical protein IT190_00010 [Microbacteriaceae bacterium]|nr:hypothetical protein [Microbacteriaceae bacterium]